MIPPSPLPDTEPPRDCPRCPRLVALRQELRAEYPEWWNAPVPAFGDPDGWLAVVGLAVAVGVVGATVVGAAEVGVGRAVVGVGERVTVGVGVGSSLPELLRAAHSAPAPRPSATATSTATTMGHLEGLASSCGGSSGGPDGGSCMVG